MIPILSWLGLRGRCARCGSGIGWRPLLMEAGLAGSAVLCVMQFGSGARAALTFSASAVLVTIAVIDWEQMRIPDSLTICLLAVSIVSSWQCGPGLIVSMSSGIVCGGVLWGVGFFWSMLRGMRALGLGDVKLYSVIGALLGWQGAIYALAVGSVLGTVVSLALQGQTLRARVPLGSYLVVGSLFVLLGATGGWPVPPR